MKQSTALNGVPGSLRQPDLPAVGLRGEVEEAEEAERRQGEGGRDELAGVRGHGVAPGEEEVAGEVGGPLGHELDPALHFVNHDGGESPLVRRRRRRRRCSGNAHAQNRFDPRVRRARALYGWRGRGRGREHATRKYLHMCTYNYKMRLGEQAHFSSKCKEICSQLSHFNRRCVPAPNLADSLGSCSSRAVRPGLGPCDVMTHDSTPPYIQFRDHLRQLLVVLNSVGRDRNPPFLPTVFF